MFKALSWGCGVQSTALAVMSALGDMEQLDLVIHADTGWEREETYRVRDFYTDWLKGKGVNVEIISEGNVRTDGVINHIHVPFWTETGGPLQRQCTVHFKVFPIRRRLREHIGCDRSRPPNPPAGSIELWLGVSLDEYTRMKRSRVQYLINRYPLVERRITRNDCIDYLENLDLPVPVKSSCVCCPYRQASEWLSMKQQNPGEFEEACQFDEENRNNPLAKRGKSTEDCLYVYKRAEPLRDADLGHDADRERKGKQVPLFICDSGYCMT